jgi:pyruvate dehydrogenase E2 component (dihydrolipoamide acetyltransferase)
VRSADNHSLTKHQEQHAMAIEVKLPNLGKGIDSADVLSILVSPGDLVQKDQDLLEIETDKATAEIPCPAAGKVAEVHVNPGQTIEVGQLLVTLEAVSSAEGSPTPAEAAGTADESKQADITKASPKKPDAKRLAAQDAVATEASGKKASETQAGTKKATEEKPETKKAGAKQPAARKVEPKEAPELPPAMLRITDDQAIPAGPAIRRLAREVGIDLSAVVGSGAEGRISRDDVLAAVRGSRGAAAATTVDLIPAVAAAPAAASDDEHMGARDAVAGDADSSDAWGPVRIERMPKIRKTIAATMHASWSTIPRVTNFDDADVTELEAVRQKSKVDYTAVGIKLTMMPFVIKAVALSLKVHPLLNASIDMQAGEICYKEYVNIGIAVDTQRGLVVPSLRNADRLCLADIARALATIAENSRTSSFRVEDLRGSTFTISNLGAIGGTYSTPIINPPEAAVLLIGRSRKMPVVVDDQVAVRLMLPLSISYDHRLVDGAAAARFLNDVKGYLQVPSRLLLAP